MSKKKHYLMGDTSVSDEQRATNAEAHEQSVDTFKQHLEAQSEKKEPKALDAQELIRKFPWNTNGDRIVILPDPVDTKLPSGIYIPDTVKEKPQLGTVISVGPDVAMNLKIVEHVVAIREMIDPTFDDDAEPTYVVNKPGDRVLFGKYAGMEVTINDVLYLVMRHGDVMATLKG